MKKLTRISVLVFVVILLIASLASCGGTTDYAGELKLDMNSSTAKEEVTVKLYIDGDTTHFNVPDSVIPGGVLKARYLAINTPESTGKIEEWGKHASNFTKEKLKGAESIIIESDTDDGKWNADSTGGRYLVWVWYRNSADEEYRNLNVEILQNGLAIASSATSNRYGTICVKARDQAAAQKLCMHSGEKDPNFFYGQAQPVTIKELRTNMEAYADSKVAFEGVVTSNDGNNGVYVESYDEETGRSYGIYVYYSATVLGSVKKMLEFGNLVQVVGSVTDFQGSWQVSGLIYDARDKANPYQMKKLGEGYEIPYTEIEIGEFVDGKETVMVGGEDGEAVEFLVSDLLLGTTVSMKDLYVYDAYMTESETDSNGSLSLYCKIGDKRVTVRTNPFVDSNGELIPTEHFLNKTIDVKGVVDLYSRTNPNGETVVSYQIAVFLLENITIQD